MTGNNICSHFKYKIDVCVLIGLTALRGNLIGSCFIQNVCEVIKELGDNRDVLSMTTEVNF